MGRVRVLLLAAVAAGCLSFAGLAAANPIVFQGVVKNYQQQQAALADPHYINPPAPPCPENGLLRPPNLPLVGNCGISQPAATSTPWPGNMAYYGGNVEVHPKIYLVYWGWGASGAFPGRSCSPVTLTQVTPNATLPCDPDGAGKYMADFVAQMGGTGWADVSAQYFQKDSAGNKTYISNDKNVLAGIWVDDGHGVTSMPSTNASNPAGTDPNASTNTYTMLAQEASRAAQHFGVSGADLANANFVVVQPPAFSDPNALNSGYCAFHDFTEPGVPGNSYYANPGVQRDIAYTNMPYSLAINSSGVNVCGKDAVNSPPQGDLDGFSIVLGHEIEETITDPGAESVVGNATTGGETYYGGWYDATDPNENGDKCAWVGENPFTLTGPPLPIYGALGNMTGNAGTQFAVQSLWSNAANGGTGYCAGAGTDSPLPSEASGSGTSSTSSGSNGSSSSGGGSSSSSTSSSSNSSSGPVVSFSPTWKSSGATKAATHRKRRTWRHHKRRTRRRTHKKK